MSAPLDTAGLAARLRAHVRDRGGMSRDAETGEIVLPNGAWAMMLAAANEIERLSALESCPVALADANQKDTAKDSELAALNDRLAKAYEAKHRCNEDANFERAQRLKSDSELAEARAALRDCVQWLEVILAEKVVEEPPHEQHIAASIARASTVLSRQKEARRD